MSGAGLAHGREIAAQMRLENVAAGRCINTKKNGEPHGPVEVGYKACSACSAAHSGPRKAATATTLEQVAIAHTTIPPVARHGAQGDPAPLNVGEGHETARGGRLSRECAICELHPARPGADVCAACWRCWTRTIAEPHVVMPAVLRSAAAFFGPSHVPPAVEPVTSAETTCSPSSSALTPPSGARSSSSEETTSDAAAPARASTAPAPPNVVGDATPIARSSSAAAAATASVSAKVAPSASAVARASTPASRASTSSRPPPPAAPPLSAAKAERLRAIAELDEERRREKRLAMRQGRGSFGLSVARSDDDEEDEPAGYAARPYSPGMSLDVHSTVEINPTNFTVEDL